MFMKQKITLISIAALCAAPLHTQDPPAAPTVAQTAAPDAVTKPAAAPDEDTKPATAAATPDPDDQTPAPPPTAEQQQQLEQIQQDQRARVPAGAAIITDQLPEDIRAQLKEQWEVKDDAEQPEETISSLGEHKSSKGGQQCPYAAECGKRYAFGIGMMAWGAAIIAAIGVIVWLGLPGKKCTPPSS